MSEEYKKRDSDDNYIHHAARLTKDPEVYQSDKTGRDGKPMPPLVRATFTSESRRENTATLWIEAKLRDYDAHIGTFLKKGDILAIEGKPVMEEYTAKDGTKKTTFKLENARLHINVELLMKLKERGFTPGAVAGGAKTAAKPGLSNFKPRAAARPVEEVDFGDE